MEAVKWNNCQTKMNIFLDIHEIIPIFFLSQLIVYGLFLNHEGNSILGKSN